MSQGGRNTQASRALRARDGRGHDGNDAQRENGEVAIREGERRTEREPRCVSDVSPNKTKLTGPPPQPIAKWKARTGGSG